MRVQDMDAATRQQECVLVMQVDTALIAMPLHSSLRAALALISTMLMSAPDCASSSATLYVSLYIV